MGFTVVYICSLLTFVVERTNPNSYKMVITSKMLRIKPKPQICQGFVSKLTSELLQRHINVIIRSLGSIITYHATTKIAIFQLVSVAEQAGLSKIWSEIPETSFSCFEVHLSLY